MHKYSNGLDLRNKYCHGNNPIDEKVSESSYYQILKIMCLIIIKLMMSFANIADLVPNLVPRKKEPLKFQRFLMFIGYSNSIVPGGLLVKS